LKNEEEEILIGTWEVTEWKINGKSSEQNDKVRREGGGEAQR